jgi:hypothetical protein
LLAAGQCGMEVAKMRFGMQARFRRIVELVQAYGLAGLESLTLNIWTAHCGRCV